MKVFYPNKLAQAVLRVEEAHPLGGNPKNALSSEQIKELVIMIDGTPESDLDSFALALSKREIYALCYYIGSNQYKVDEKKLAAVIRQRMNSVCYGILLNVWQDEPESLETIRLLGSKEAIANRPENCAVSVRLILQCSGSSNPAQVLALDVLQSGFGAKFAQRYDSRGLKPDTALSLKCNFYYLTNASLQQFINEGDTSISGVLKKLTQAQKAAVIKRLLFVVQNNRAMLIPMLKTFEVAKTTLGTPERLRFNSEFSSVLNTYKWWYNYYILSSLLTGDKRRIEFWQSYLTDCTFDEDKKHDMMIMRFSRYVAIEFCTIGAMYIFDTAYFDATVKSKMRQYSNTAMLKSWMLHDSRFAERESHHGMWENKFAAILRNRGIRAR